jgi:hypothetical protein
LNRGEDDRGRADAGPTVTTIVSVIIGARSNPRSEIRRSFSMVSSGSDHGTLQNSWP